MKYDTVSLQSVVDQAIEEAGMDREEVRMQLFKRWATEAASMVPVQEELVHRLDLIPVENAKALLPNDFKLLQQVVGRVERDDSCGRVEKLSQWVQGTQDPDVSLEINLVCSKCSKRACSCGQPVIEIDVDRTWELAHPESYLKRWDRTETIGMGSGSSSNRHGVHKKEWQLLRYAQGDFFKANIFLKDCPNFHVPVGYNSFSITKPYIDVDFPTGEIILSYLGRQMDANGDIRVPDQVDLKEAIKYHIMHKYFQQKYYRAIGGTTENAAAFGQASNMAESKREASFRLYKAQAIIPEFHDFRNFMQRTWMQRFPEHNWTEKGNHLPNIGRAERYRNFLS